MVPRLVPLALLVAALVFLWRDGAARALGFATTRRPSGGQPAAASPSEHLAPSALPAAHGAAARRHSGFLGRPVASVVAQPARPGLAGKAAWAAVGLAVAGAAFGRLRQRGCSTALGAHRPPSHFKQVYGGEGPPKQPEWLGTDKVPPWLTLQKWQSFKAYDRARSRRWFLQYHDDVGKPILTKGKEYTISEATDILLRMATVGAVKTDQVVECVMRMNLDYKFPDQQVRCSISLPHGTGKNVKVGVFCPPEDEEEVMRLGAHKCGKILAEEIAEEKIDFDVLLARPQMMPRLAKLGRILGPLRLMPSPKSGTVVQDYAAAIASFKAGSTIELRGDTRSQVMCPCGRVSFGKAKMEQNFRAVLTELADKKPEGAKAEFWKAVYMKLTQTPAIKIAASEFPKLMIQQDED